MMRLREATLTTSLAHAGTIINNLQYGKLRVATEANVILLTNAATSSSILAIQMY